MKELMLFHFQPVIQADVNNVSPFPPRSSVVGPAVGQTREDFGQTPQACSEPL